MRLTYAAGTFKMRWRKRACAASPDLRRDLVTVFISLNLRIYAYSDMESIRRAELVRIALIRRRFQLFVERLCELFGPSQFLFDHHLFRSKTLGLTNERTNGPKSVLQTFCFLRKRYPEKNTRGEEVGHEMPVKHGAILA